MVYPHITTGLLGTAEHKTKTNPSLNRAQRCSHSPFIPPICAGAPEIGLRSNNKKKGSRDGRSTESHFSSELAEKLRPAGGADSASVILAAPRRFLLKKQTRTKSDLPGRNPVERSCFPRYSGVFIPFVDCRRSGFGVSPPPRAHRGGRAGLVRRSAVF